MIDKVVDTAAIITVEVEVKPFYREFRWWLNTLTAFTGGVQTVLILVSEKLKGVAWFWVVLFFIGGINAVLGFWSKYGVVSKNKREDLVGGLYNGI